MYAWGTMPTLTSLLDGHSRSRADDREHVRKALVSGDDMG